jgi:signal peptidase II
MTLRTLNYAAAAPLTYLAKGKTVALPKSTTQRRSAGSRMTAGKWLVVALLLVGLDQATKLAVANLYELGYQQAITSWFNLVRVHNSGAAFSFLANAGGWQRWFFIGLGVVAVGYLGFLLVRHASQGWFAFAATLIIAGAIGNTIDRASWGYVIDFIDLHAAGWHWPAFNLADSYITVGAVLFVLDEIRRVRRG